ncbi:MAG TPA: AMP-dependent synthetase/ligase [Gordonia sp. (in: high G+C Gram-positive bacteria)]|uniref:AMP-dependent synthetase/ligase n=1 Tax=unclassified Gordonia (in: high G+C Gram-positive bacteria) TaxID=2657482 RepID=UPI0025BE8222|nr:MULTISPECIES: AMP-dependent synthetase/ligase [unclassified Gordonia (in: high G+C Gram-positive bacteria)]HNP56208.1 AMP-dependent synthetase/ligase [Gordonia sp. (in: high G+C Gram-positive bacteria)]HRC50341.1 AMP-dependent synthetase/ligase [Gordonia sp. (in: high G+C Gram-positive bacteria)]
MTEAQTRTTAAQIADLLDRSTSMCDVLLATARTHPDDDAVRSFTTGQVWTYDELMARIGSVAQRLQGVGVGRGDTVALMMRNIPEFHVVDAAAMMLGAVPFSIYNSFSAGQIHYVLANSSAQVVIAEAAFVPVIEEARALGVSVTHVLTVEASVDGQLDLSSELAAESTDFDFTAAASAVGGDDLLTLIYTSGTTGPPKGVELTHAGMLAQLRGIHEYLPLDGGGRQVGFLPAAHVADRWTSHYSALFTYANTLTCVADMADVPAALASVRPTVCGAVPRVWEKLKAGAESAYPGDLATDAAADDGLAAAIRQRLGLDQVQWAITGAAPTPLAVIEFFGALRLPLCEVLGMSEGSCCVTANTPTEIRPGSVGRPLREVEVATAPDGELLLRGPQVMRGYRADPVRTAEVIDGDGWLHTGDIATIDADGFITVVDRKKDIMINSAGKNMSPANIEGAVMSAGRLIANVCVIGDARRFVTALAVVDPATTDCLSRDELREGLRSQVSAANKNLARVEQIKKFLIVDDVWSPAAELTPTMKMRRNVVHDRYGSAIEALYDDAIATDYEVVDVT